MHDPETSEVNREKAVKQRYCFYEIHFDYEKAKDHTKLEECAEPRVRGNAFLERTNPAGIYLQSS